MFGEDQHFVVCRHVDDPVQFQILPSGLQLQVIDLPDAPLVVHPSQAGVEALVALRTENPVMPVRSVSDEETPGSQ